MRAYEGGNDELLYHTNIATRFPRHTLYSSVAAEMSFVRPVIVDDDERTVLVENGRSPLQELLTDHRYIPNDVGSLPLIVEGGDEQKLNGIGGFSAS